MLELLDGWLRHKSDMVNFEAARAICEMKNVTAAQLTKPISGQSLFITSFIVYLWNEMLVLQLFLSSPKPVLKFAATRTLAALALSHPTSVATCNVDLESLIADQNRSVATYAITTLLKVSLSLLVECLIFMQVFIDRQRGICGPSYQTNHRLHD